MTLLSRRTFLRTATATALVAVAAPAIVRAASLELAPVRHRDWAGMARALADCPAKPWYEVLEIANLSPTLTLEIRSEGHHVMTLAPGQASQGPSFIMRELAPAPAAPATCAIDWLELPS